MTGGRVVVLGKTGRNFGAGMSGGIAYVWDPSKEGNKYINHEMVDVEYLIYEEDVNEVHELVKKHFQYTGSKRAEKILANWEKEKDNFWKIIPGEYKKALVRLAKEEAEKKSAGKEVEAEETLHG
jgi:glutamate synthase domain-containing protein 3